MEDEIKSDLPTAKKVEPNQHDKLFSVVMIVIIAVIFVTIWACFFNRSSNPDNEANNNRTISDISKAMERRDYSFSPTMTDAEKFELAQSCRQEESVIIPAVNIDPNAFTNVIISCVYNYRSTPGISVTPIKDPQG